MRLHQWTADSLDYVRSHGLAAGIRLSARDLLFGLYHNLPIAEGRPVYDEPWDVLVILDACRVDVLEEVAPDYDFLPERIPSFPSLASTSSTWLAENFDDRFRVEMANTVYVTGNPYSDQFLSADDFQMLDEVWRYVWDDDLGGIPARAITDRAIAHGREREFDRMIVHYMQPHFPSFPDPLGSATRRETWGEWPDSIWNRLEKGDVSRERVWRSYRANLEYVLDDVAILIENLDAERVVISADHGNAFGEYGVYGHPENKPIRALRRVPWVVTSAIDRATYTPQLQEGTTDVPDTKIRSRLRDLGYLE